MSMYFTMKKRIEKEVALAYDDVAIIPSSISRINHRTECNPFDENGFLPIFASPMSTVVNESNFSLFEENKIIPILPKTNDITLETRIKYSTNGKWAAYSLDEFESIFANTDSKMNLTSKTYVLIDIANGHMKRTFDLVEIAKKMYGDNIIIMVGNIANHETYYYATKSGVDYIRVGIGNGEGCLTYDLTGVNYPMASLIEKMVEFKEYARASLGNSMKLPKIVADGGIRNFRDVNKALAIGADYVMIGGLFARLYESASPCLLYNVYSEFMSSLSGLNIPIETKSGTELLSDPNFEYSDKPKYKGKNVVVEKMFYGMASKNGQEDRNNEQKVPEGLAKRVQASMRMSDWVEIMEHSLKCVMSYSDSANLEEFRNKATLTRISEWAIWGLGKRETLDIVKPYGVDV